MSSSSPAPTAASNSFVVFFTEVINASFFVVVDLITELNADFNLLFIASEIVFSSEISVLRISDISIEVWVRFLSIEETVFSTHLSNSELRVFPAVSQEFCSSLFWLCNSSRIRVRVSPRLVSHSVPRVVANVFREVYSSSRELLTLSR